MSKHNNLLPHLWGSSQWDMMHSISFSYPEEPTSVEKQNYKNYFESLGFVLPCCACADSYKEFLAKQFVLTDKVLSSRKTLVQWAFDLHNAVNAKLGKVYDITLEDLYAKYESYRNACEMAPDVLRQAYTHKYYPWVPKISVENALKFSAYAEKRGVLDFGKTSEDFSENKRERKIIVDEIIKLKTTSSSIESDGPYKGMPTVDELNLMKYLVTTLDSEDINKMTIRKKYKLVK
jgi:hypothetical protein